jgi:hypothetical protein
MTKPIKGMDNKMEEKIHQWIKPLGIRGRIRVKEQEKN